MPSAFIAKLDPDTGAGLLGDKSWNAMFDNSKVKSFVPGWHAHIPFAEGIRRTVAWFDADPARQASTRRPTPTSTTCCAPGSADPSASPRTVARDVRNLLFLRLSFPIDA